MSLRDKANDVAEKARRYTVAHQGKIAEGIDKVEALVDKRTGGQYHDRVAEAGGKAKEYVETLPQTNSEREARTMTAEPSVNDLSPMLAPGVENEPMLLLDTTGSMSYPVSQDSRVERRQVIGEAIGRIVEVMGATDSQAAKEQAKGEDAGGLMTVTFAGGSAQCIEDLSPTNWRQKWNAIRWGGAPRSCRAGRPSWTPT